MSKRVSEIAPPWCHWWIKIHLPKVLKEKQNPDPGDSFQKETPFLWMSWFLPFGRGYTRAVLPLLEVFFHEEILFAHATSKWQQQQRGLAIDPALNSCFSNSGRSVFVAISVTRCSAHSWPSGTASWSCFALPCLPCPSSVNKQVGKEFHHVKNSRLFKQLSHLTLPRFQTELSCCPDVRSFVIFYRCFESNHSA